VVRLNSRDDTVFRRCGPPERQGSSSRMPATAAIDNETLDHLLSVVDDSGNLSGNRELSKPRPHPKSKVMRAGFLDFAHIPFGKPPPPRAGMEQAFARAALFSADQVLFDQVLGCGLQASAAASASRASFLVL